MHLPVHGKLDVGGWEIEIFLEQRGALGAPMEAIFVDTVHGRVRLAVVDPAVNAENPEAENLAAGAWGILTGVLRTATSPENALTTANTLIYKTYSERAGWAYGPMLCAGVADLHPFEPLILGAARVGDSEIHGDGFALAGNCFTDECVKRLRALKGPIHPSDPARWHAQRTNTNVDDYLSTPLGLTEPVKIETWGPTRTRHIRLCTDGETTQRTTADLLQDCDSEPSGRHAYPHSDRARLNATWKR